MVLQIHFNALKEMSNMTTATKKGTAAKPATKAPAKKPAATKAAPKAPAKKPVATKPAAAKTARKPVAKPAAKAPAKKPAPKVKATVMALDLTELLKAFAAGGKSPRNVRLPGSVDVNVKAALIAEAKRLKISVSALTSAIVTQYIATLSA